jgi:hypothetical protein
MRSELDQTAFCPVCQLSSIHLDANVDVAAMPAVAGRIRPSSSLSEDFAAPLSLGAELASFTQSLDETEEEDARASPNDKVILGVPTDLADEVREGDWSLLPMYSKTS